MKLLEKIIPPGFDDFQWQNFINLVLIFFFALILSLITHMIIYFILKRLSVQSKSAVLKTINQQTRRPAYLFILLFYLNLFTPLLQLTEKLNQLGQKMMLIGFIIAAAWFSIAMTHLLDTLIIRHFGTNRKDNFEVRKIDTLTTVLKRIINFMIILIAVSAILMSIDRVRQLGQGLFTSAGILGIILGIAAQKTIGNIFAGLQIAITQPIRLDDVVIVEGEWGWIEEINLTYVVVRIWDLRRLIVPVNYFIEKPFQNWTRKSTAILGTIFFYVDYTFPVIKLREELLNIVHNSQLWDKKVCSLQVTNINQQTIELRALVSAEDSTKVWTLRCETREKLIDFVQENYPEYLPKFRADFEPYIKK